MSNNLTVWTAAKEVSTALGAMVNTYKTLRTVKKQESIILKEKIRAFQTIARARGMGEVARANIDEIAKTYYWGGRDSRYRSGSGGTRDIFKCNGRHGDTGSEPGAGNHRRIQPGTHNGRDGRRG